MTKEIHFEKYDTRHDYHWKEYEAGTIYTKHANRVRDWIKEKNVLDIGCGDGLITHLIGGKGIDTHEYAISLAHKHGIDAIVGSVYDLEELGKFDAVYFGDTLEHLKYPELALQEIAKITDKMYLVTPPRRGEKLRPHHYMEWTPEELQIFCKKYGWNLQGAIEEDNDRMYGLFTLSKKEN